MFEGTTITIQGQKYIVPPLSFSGMKKIEQDLLVLNDPKSTDFSKICVMVKAIKLALRRNYPDMTDEQIEDMIDVGNINNVFDAIMGASGLEKKPGEN